MGGPSRLLKGWIVRGGVVFSDAGSFLSFELPTRSVMGPVGAALVRWEAVPNQHSLSSSRPFLRMVRGRFARPRRGHLPYGPNAIAPIPGSVTTGALAPAFAGTS